MPKFYDMSQPIFHDCPAWPTNPPVTLTHDWRLAVDGYNGETLKLATHSGTHIDAPFHFYADGETLDQLPIGHFAGIGVFLDLRGKVQADAPITREILAPFSGQVSPGDFCMLNTGWHLKRAHTEEYLFQWPYLDESAANLLIELGVRAVGIDGLSIGGWGADRARPAHLALLRKKILLIEEAVYPEELMDGQKRLVMAFPLPLQGVGGCPIRLVAMDL